MILPPHLPPDLDAIPVALQILPRWVGWRYIKRERWTKMPVHPRAPYSPASSVDPATWGTFEEAAAAYRADGVHGVGIVLGDGLCGFDIDDCVGDDRLDPEIERVVRMLASYTEFSVSGRGIHVLMRGTKPAGRCRTGKFELYGHSRFFTVSGFQVSDQLPATIEERSPQIAALAKELFGVEARPEEVIWTRPPSTSQASTLTDDELLARAMTSPRFAALWRGDTSAYYGDDSAADFALCTSLAFWTCHDPERIDRLFRRSGLYRPKWESRRGAQTYGVQTITRAMSAQQESYRNDDRSTITRIVRIA